MASDLEAAILRLTHWIAAYGDDKSKEFIGDLSIVLLAAKDADRYRDALEAIVNHQEQIGGGLSVMSATRRIAQAALGSSDNGTTQV